MSRNGLPVKTVGLAYVGSNPTLPPAESARELGFPGLAGLLAVVVRRIVVPVARKMASKEAVKFDP